jgi:hypothetical protein
MKYVNSITGQQGKWWAWVEYDDGTREKVPCVHGTYWAPGGGRHYHDPWHNERRAMRATKKFAEHCEMFLTLRRVVVTDSNVLPDRARPGQLRRVSYRGNVVFNIDNVEIGDRGIEFDFDGVYAKRRR